MSDIAQILSRSSAIADWSLISSLAFTATAAISNVDLAALRASRNAMSAPPGNGCVGASILPREAVGTQAQHAAQNRISLALANRYPAGSPLWHLFNNFYRHTVHKADCAENLHEEVMHD